ncbi:MAG: hypothetical protein IT161_08805 [Bryobacterales bacterium]|nr:hypothetical protein [Bryobacterales bacterium]
MSDPTKISGRLTSSEQGRVYSGYRVVALFQEQVVLDGGGSSLTPPPFLPSRRVAAVNNDGTFEITLPEKERWQPPVSVYAENSAGIRLGEMPLNPETLDNIRLPVRPEPPPQVIQSSDDPTLGQRIKFTGRAIDSRGNGLKSGPLIVFWGVPPDGSTEDRFPVAIAQIGGGGYFSGTWPPDILGSAFAQIQGGAPIDVALDAGRFPKRVILVHDLPISDGANGSTAPPRFPDQVDLSEDPEAFAADPKPCVDFTVPNRTVEEVTYFALVRTTQPDVQSPFRPPRPLPLPPTLVNHIVDLASRAAEFEITIPPAKPTPTVVAASGLSSASTATRGIVAIDQPALSRAAASDSDPVTSSLNAAASLFTASAATAAPASADEVALRLLQRRDLQKNPLQFESSVLAEVARQPGPITPRRILQAEQASTVRKVRSAIHCVAAPLADRFHPSVDRQVDWEMIPALYQASTIAHGHLLTIKQVWRSDGYSLGDLLYSLPLAPGQQKLISILDWQRREIAMRAETRRVSEDLNATLLHDRDISEVVSASLSESMVGKSSASVKAVGGAVGGFIGALVFGAAGGVSSARSSASQVSARDVAGSVLNVARDRTMQAASAVRSQRSTVVQTARQGETVRAQTEVIANYNHCHALTIEYFEVLRHLQVTQEVAAVRECLFIPLLITSFSVDKALSWRVPLTAALRSRDLLPYFDALERVAIDWQQADYPLARYADDLVTHLEGEIRVRMQIPRPADKDDGSFDSTQWDPYTPLLSQAPQDVWQRFMGVALPASRPAIWNTRLAPGIAQRLLDFLQVEVRLDNGTYRQIPLDVSMVSGFQQNGPLYVTFRPLGALPAFTRAQVERVRLSFTGLVLPAGIEAMADSGSMFYRTDHINHDLFRDYRILNDLTDSVEVITPLDTYEKRNPREQDRRQTEALLDHLNEHIEYYHRAIWMLMDPNRRYMLLDGVIAPNASGRSVATVVENRVLTVVGNSLVMPVANGIQLDSTYVYSENTPEELIQLYATDRPDPMRVSLPTTGVFAEAVLGKCNSCELIDDTVFWRWEEAPIPDSPVAIGAISTAPRDVQAPNLQPTAFPDGIVRLQQAPAAPAPTGMEAALQALGINNIFRDLTGLQANQAAAAAALDSVMGAAKSFASQGKELAQQQFLNGQMDRALSHVKQARDKNLLPPDKANDLTSDLFSKALGVPKPEEKAPTATSGAQSFLDRIASGVSSAALRVVRAAGSLDLSVGPDAKTSPVDFEVTPPLSPVKQDSPNTCWAAAATMMVSWREQTPKSTETVLGDLGGEWLAAYKSGQALTVPQLHALGQALALSEEPRNAVTVDGLLQLLRKHGPLWVIADDSIDNNKLVHARIVTALKGDGAVGNTQVTYIDTATGDFAPPESFTTFLQKFTSADAGTVDIGMLHY